MEKRKELIQKLESALKDLDAKLDGLDQSSKVLKETLKDKLNEEVTRLRSKTDEVHYTLKQAKNAGESALDELQKGADKALKELHASIQSALEKFAPKP